LSGETTGISGKFGHGHAGAEFLTCVTGGGGGPFGGVNSIGSCEAMNELKADAAEIQGFPPVLRDRVGFCSAGRTIQ
jgi:hypothetical protein